MPSVSFAAVTRLNGTLRDVYHNVAYNFATCSHGKNCFSKELFHNVSFCSSARRRKRNRSIRMPRWSIQDWWAKCNTNLNKSFETWGKHGHMIYYTILYYTSPIIYIVIYLSCISWMHNMSYYVIFLALVKPSSLQFDSKLISGNIIRRVVSGNEEHFLEEK